MRPAAKSSTFVIPFCGLLCALLSAPALLSAQTQPVPPDVTAAVQPTVTPSATAAVTGISQMPGDARPTLVVMSFESGTVAAKVKDRHGFSAFLAAMRGDQDNEHYDPAELGTGIADMLVEKLLNTGEFRLLERKQLEATAREQNIVSAGGTAVVLNGAGAVPPVKASVIGARYMVTGSVTKFGFEEHQVGGFATSMATFGLLSVKRHTTEVKLTARVVDVATGEIVASFDGEGVSNKGGGIRLLGMGSNGGGGAGGENKNFKETAIGEATERAVQNLTEKLQSKRAMLASR